MTRRENTSFAPAAIIWNGARRRATFTHAGVVYVVTFRAGMLHRPEFGSRSGYTVEFHRLRDEGMPWQHKLTGEGGAVQILASVGAAVREFIARTKPSVLRFVADEPSRMRLYARLLPRLEVPGEYSAIDPDDEDRASGHLFLVRTHLPGGRYFGPAARAPNPATIPCGDCFGFALEEGRQRGATVVHAVVTDPLDSNHVYQHAWVELHGYAYDYQGRHMPVPAYYKTFKPTGVVKYTPTEATVLMLRSGHTGPWTERPDPKMYARVPLPARALPAPAPAKPAPARRPPRVRAPSITALERQALDARRTGDIAEARELERQIAEMKAKRKKNPVPAWVSRDLYRGRHDAGPPTFNAHGILWLSPNKAVAREYALPYYVKRGYVWTVRLRDGARVVDLDDLGEKPVHALFEATNAVRRSKLGPWTAAQWLESADFGIFDTYPWAAQFLAKRGIDAVIVKDSLGTTGVPHVSLAVLRKKAIESATREPVEQGSKRRIGDIAREAAEHEPSRRPKRRQNPISMKEAHRANAEPFVVDPFAHPWTSTLPALVIRAEKHFGVESEDRIHGCGSYGCAVALRNGSVLKITTDEAEVLTVDTVLSLAPADRVGFVTIRRTPERLSTWSRAWSRDPDDRDVWAYIRDEVTVGHHFWLKKKRLTKSAFQRLVGAFKSLSGGAGASMTTEAYLDIVAGLAEHDELADVVRTLRAAAKKGVLLMDVYALNFGTTADGRTVLFDARGVAPREG